MITAAATTGPASGPTPTSSTPASRRIPRSRYGCSLRRSRHITGTTRFLVAFALATVVMGHHPRARLGGPQPARRERTQREVKIYTRSGDRGETALFGGGRVMKDTIASRPTAPRTN